MQAVILVGGEGTRLRPLTSTVPKPVVPLVDRPFIAYMLEWLKRHGVDDVIMSCGFLATAVRNVLGDGSGYGIRLRFVEEPDPRGTAGADRGRGWRIAGIASFSASSSPRAAASSRSTSAPQSNATAAIPQPMSPPTAAG